VFIAPEAVEQKLAGKNLLMSLGDAARTGAWSLPTSTLGIGDGSRALSPPLASASALSTAFACGCALNRSRSLHPPKQSWRCRMSKIRYEDLPADTRAEIELEFGPDPTGEAAKKTNRREQRRGFAERKPRPSTGNPAGRPRLTEDERVGATAKRRAAQSAWVAAKRVRLKESTENSGGRPEPHGT
jgi:hypothetical protein